MSPVFCIENDHRYAGQSLLLLNENHISAPMLRPHLGERSEHLVPTPRGPRTARQQLSRKDGNAG